VRTARLGGTVGQPNGNTRFRTPGCEWGENIKLDIKDKDMCWIRLAQGKDQ